MRKSKIKIMKIENQVCTLEQAKRLNDLGIFQGNSAFYFNTNSRRIEYNTGYEEHPSNGKHYEFCFSAFTVAELGVMLPDIITGDHLYTFQQRRATLDKNYKRTHDVSYWCIGDIILYTSKSDNEAEARAAMLIHLLKEKLITPEEVNKRLSES